MNSVISNDPVEGHTHKALDFALSELRSVTTSMGGLVINQVSTAVQSLLRGDGVLSAQVLSRESEVNRLHRQINQTAFEVLARHQLMANDLRLVLALRRISHELERAGDEAKKIAAFASRVANGASQGPVATVAAFLRHMADLSTHMLREAVRSLDENDIALAHSARDRDVDLDTEFADALRRVFTLVMEGEPYLRATIDTVFALKGLERIGDHGKNIAEQVMFIIQDGG
jgi:phosphate transport system protein